MRGSDFFLAEGILKDKYNISLIDDVILNGDKKIYLYADLNESKDLKLNVIIGDLGFFGFENTSSIMIDEILKDIDYNNEYTKVSGRKEYLEFVKQQIMDFNRNTNIAIPLKTKFGRKWMNIYHQPVRKNPDIIYFILNDFTDIMTTEELNWLKSHKDSLTGLYNKYTLDYHYGLRYMRKNFHAIYLDIDNLKRVNDEYGHYLGDQTLVAFSNILKKYESEYNHFYRVGGDEFVGLFFETEDVIKNLVESILKETRSDYLLTSKVNVTVSIGVVKATKRDDVIRRADELLYKVKKEGKDNYHYEIEPI